MIQAVAYGSDGVRRVLKFELVSRSGHRDAINISNERLTNFADEFAVLDSFFYMTIINIGNTVVVEKHAYSSLPSNHFLDAWDFE